MGAAFDEHELAMGKQGADLFKELFRIYSVAEVDDYFKAGRWQNDLMKQDFLTIRLHRREAGAPEAPAMEDVKLPELPVETPQFNPVQQQVRPVMPGGFAMGGPGMVGVRPGMPGMGATGPASAAVVRPKVAQPAAVAGGAVAELRLIALFVAKWKLDPTKTKTALAKITPQRRRYVIQNFKTALTGLEATTALEEYIAECDTTGKWDNATGPMAALAAAQAAKAPAVAVTPKAAAPPKAAGSIGVAVAANAGVKRPIAQVGGPVAAQGGAAKQPAWGAAGGLRPAMVRPGLRPAMTVAAPVRPAGGAPKAGGVIAGLLNKF